ncbi:MAG TPA: PAS domain-containing protein [Geothrix sp.]|jgi:PAS domain S-box-containing protein
MSSTEPRLEAGEYAVLVEQAPILIWRAGTSGLCDYFNQRWLDFTGRSMAQEYGNGWAEGVHPEDLQRCLDIYTDHFNRRALFEMEYRLRRHDGAWRWIFDRGAPMYGPDGAFAGFIGSCTDITDRVETQAALDEALASQIRTLQGLLPLCMFCKKIKNDDGYWEALEHYVREHSDADFSHGLCPDCFPAYMAQIQAEAADSQKNRH